MKKLLEVGKVFPSFEEVISISISGENIPALFVTIDEQEKGEVHHIPCRRDYTHERDYYRALARYALAFKEASRR